ncbi:hypothetical protein [Plantactinospora endophytica]|uniref:Lipoprotein n=1 Tax=Plantactinospora endophytica TaxID=673535 RepID=A0ABQ4E9I5_9ACTN|nr:hypothetical protein [Plantactinospora endophytica]GIG91388.1 hypothetical protein Pen02_63240 [Plantactinospora endophytica]
MSSWRRSGSLLVAAVLLVGAGGCGLGPGSGGGSADGEAASEAGRTYGYGPTRDRSVRYQPDVVLVEGGPDAVRSASADGTTWVLDADAPGADELEPGRIMYATSRAVGRVEQVRRTGDDLAVTLSPVTLTEVFRDAHFRSDRTIDDAALAYQEVPRLPGAVSVPSGTRSPEDAVTPIGLTAGAARSRPTAVPGGAAASPDGTTVLALDPIRLAPAGAGRLPPARERNFAVTVGDWEAQPYRTPGKLGLKIGYAANENLKVYIDFAMNVDNLRIRTDVPISNGRIGGAATFAVDGIRSISVDVAAGAANGADDNKKVRVEVPVEINIPIPGEALVYSNTWKFIVTTGLSGRNTTVKAAGEWAVNGTLGMIDGSLQKPTLSVVRSIMDSITGISVGPSGLAFAVETKIQFGIGIPAAFAGPYAKLVVDLGVTNGSALGAPLARCVSASLNAKVGGGFGVTASSVAIAELQKLLPTKLKFELESEKLWPIHRAAQTLPNVPLCVG